MDELGLLIRSRYPILTVETHEESRLLELLAARARELNLAFFVWSVTDGLQRHGLNQPVYETQEPAKVLRHIETIETPSLFLLRDFHPFLNDPVLVRLLRDIAQEKAHVPVTLVLSAPALDLPRELRTLAARYRLRLPEEKELRRLVLDTFGHLNPDKKKAYRLTDDELGTLVRNLKGLTLEEARRVVGRCVLDDNVLDAADVLHALAVKKEHIEQSGILEYFEVGTDTPSLGGLRRLKEWLRRYQAGFSERARRLGLRPPRGVLFVGVQGCGKSLASKTIAREWNLPLLRLDPGRLLDKYIGESEKNLRHAFDTAEGVSPVVLWIDEIEKAFAGSAGSEADAGLGRRLFGSFLTWLQEKRESVFVAATANDLAATPPELLRKGRFDEVFFVDLPDEEERREIFSIHLSLRKQNPRDFDLEALAQGSDGFSGAEIEQVVVAALYGLLAENAERLTTERLQAELAATVPLARARREQIAELRAFARDRFVPAR